MRGEEPSFKGLKQPTDFVWPHRDRPSTREGRAAYKLETAKLTELYKGILAENSERRRRLGARRRFLAAKDEQSRLPCEPDRTRAALLRHRERFTKKEMEVSNLLLEGKTFTEVAELTGLAALRVWSMRGTILMKLRKGVQTRAHFIKRWWFPILPYVNLYKWDKERGLYVEKASADPDKVHGHCETGETGSPNRPDGDKDRASEDFEPRQTAGDKGPKGRQTQTQGSAKVRARVEGTSQKVRTVRHNEVPDAISSTQKGQQRTVVEVRRVFGQRSATGATAEEVGKPIVVSIRRTPRGQ